LGGSTTQIPPYILSTTEIPKDSFLIMDENYDTIIMTGARFCCSYDIIIPMLIIHVVFQIRIQNGITIEPLRG